METWITGTAIRAHKAETPKQPSCCLRVRALHFYPDPRKRRFNCDSQEPVENLGAWEEWGADNLGRGGQ
jgi:hypothetical protein